MENKIDKLVKRITQGKRKFVVVNRKDLPKVADIIESKYIGVVTWFGFGETAHCMRKNKKPMQLRSAGASD